MLLPSKRKTVREGNTLSHQNIYICLFKLTSINMKFSCLPASTWKMISGRGLLPSQFVNSGNTTSQISIFFLLLFSSLGKFVSVSPPTHSSLFLWGLWHLYKAHCWRITLCAGFHLTWNNTIQWQFLCHHYRWGSLIPVSNTDRDSGSTVVLISSYLVSYIVMASLPLTTSHGLLPKRVVIQY